MRRNDIHKFAGLGCVDADYSLLISTHFQNSIYVKTLLEKINSKQLTFP